MSFNLVRLTLYGLITAIDADLRALVRFQLGSSTAIEAIFPADTLAKLRDRAARDGAADDDDIYEYLDFADSAQILRAHKASLDPAIAKFVNVNSTELDRLIPIRNRVMHARPLQFADYSTVDIFVKQLHSYPKALFPRVIEFEERVRENPNFVYSVDISQADQQVDRIPHNLPLPDYDETGFLGREQETSELLAACKSNWPVVTVVGEGGFGKTALALRVAYDLLDDETAGFEAIVWTTAKRTVLTLNDIQTIDGAIQNSLGLIRSASDVLGGVGSDEAILDEVASYLNTFKILLVLDNLETVLDPLLTRFIRKSSGNSKILATSRVGIGEMSYPFKLGGLNSQEAVQLLRLTAKVRRVPDIYKAKNESLKKYVQQMKLNPGFIKWFVSSVQCGKRPEQALANPKIFLDFCLSNVYEFLTADGKTVCKAIIAVPGKQSLPLISYLTEISGDRLQEALAGLQSANILQMSSTLTEAGSETVFQLNELPRLFILRNHPPNAVEDAIFKQRMRDVSTQYERLQAERGANKYNPRVIACRNQADAITAKLLSEALGSVYSNDREKALNLVERAKELDPAFYEVYRVEAWVHAHTDNPAAAADAYQSAIVFEPRSAPTRYWYAGFLLRAAHDPDGAREQLLVAEGLDPDSAAVLVELARVEMFLGHNAEADGRLQRVFHNPDVSTRQQRVAYDTWCQVALRKASAFFDEGRYSDSLSACQDVLTRFRSVPDELLDERIVSTGKRTLGVLSQLADQLSLSSLLPEVQRCYADIEDIRFNPVANIKLPVSSRGDATGDLALLQRIGTICTGSIDRVNVPKRYGFIRFEGDKRVFFHFSAFPHALTFAIPGNEVRFTIVEREGRPAAGEIAMVGSQLAAEEPSQPGWIKSVFPDKSFAFLTDSAGHDYFFHRSNLAARVELESLNVGDRVTFRIGQNHKGPVADDVRPHPSELIVVGPSSPAGADV
ncbi:cold shock domain-containing protein [Mesorhizobium sp. M1148]|uniref:cold shock domain-containing protein n=1 Tax=unclassified Mesorhizobium TaxID=325217 RepID=UPI0033357021